MFAVSTSSPDERNTREYRIPTLKELKNNNLELINLRDRSCDYEVARSVPARKNIAGAIIRTGMLKVVAVQSSK